MGEFGLNLDRVSVLHNEKVPNAEGSDGHRSVGKYLMSQNCTL